MNLLASAWTSQHIEYLLGWLELIENLLRVGVWFVMCKFAWDIGGIIMRGRPR